MPRLFKPNENHDPFREIALGGGLGLKQVQIPQIVPGWSQVRQVERRHSDRVRNNLINRRRVGKLRT